MRRSKREKGRKAALATLMARRAKAGNPPPLDESKFQTAKEALAAEHKDELMDHLAELRSLGLDPNLIGEHEVDPVMCECCGEPIPWRVILTYRN